MAVYVANKNGGWNDLSTWLSSSDAYAVTTASWQAATALPTFDDDVYANGYAVQLIPNYVHTANMITNTQLYGSSSATALIRGTSTGYFAMTSSAVTYYITASQIIGSGWSNTETIQTTTAASRSFYYISSSINAAHNADGKVVLLINALSSSVYIRGDLYSGYNIGTVTLSNNRSILEITGSIYSANASVTTVATVLLSGQFISCSVSGSVTTTGQPAILTTTSGSMVRVTGTVAAGPRYPAISGSTVAALSQSVQIFGNVINDSVTGQQAVIGNRIFISGGNAASLQVKSNPAGNITLQDTGSSITYTYASAVDVVNGYLYNNNTLKGTGLITGSFSKHVRSGVGFTQANKYNDGTGDVWTIQTVSGSCYMPHSSSVRAGTSYDSASTLGAMTVPSQSQTQYGAFFSTSSLTGSYQSASQYWSTGSNSFTQISSIGYLLSRSLDVSLSSVTGSFVTDLNAANATSNIILRIQNVHTTQSVSQSIGSYI